MQTNYGVGRLYSTDGIPTLFDFSHPVNQKDFFASPKVSLPLAAP
jgi:hypothetical protein